VSAPLALATHQRARVATPAARAPAQSGTPGCHAAAFAISRAGTGWLQRQPEPVATAPTAKLAINAQRTGPGVTMGHAFISLTNDKGERHQWGFYPACSQCSSFGNCSTLDQLDIISFGAVDGVVCNDDNSNPDTRYETPITMDQYAEGRALIQKLTLNPPKYHLRAFSCVGFMRYVASHLGLALPDFPGIDDPDDVANEIDKRLIAEGSFYIESLAGDPVDLSKEKPYFSVKGLPRDHTIKFRWMIVSAAGERILMRNDVGVALNYSRHAKDAYIGDASRELMRKKEVREGKILCRLSPTDDEADPDTKLLERSVKFTW
jgi:hypothetical protein